MNFPNHYQKVALAFMLMFCVMRILYQDRDINAIENVFSTLYKWFVSDYFSIHFGEDKTKCILFSKSKRSSKLNIT